MYFVNNLQYMCSETNYTNNVHNLINLPSNVRQHGPLDNFSAFPFENFMSEIKRMIRKPNSVVAQIFKRCAEQNSNFVITLHKTLQTNQACQTETTYFRNCDANGGVKLKSSTFGKILNFRYMSALKYSPTTTN